MPGGSEKFLDTKLQQKQLGGILQENQVILYIKMDFQYFFGRLFFGILPKNHPQRLD